MAEGEVRVGDAGTQFTFTVQESSTAVDISAATLTGILLLKKPSGTTTTLTASFVTAGTDGAIIYTSTAADFEETGTHRFQIKIDDGTNSWHTDLFKFNVESNLS